MAAAGRSASLVGEAVTGASRRRGHQFSAAEPHRGVALPQTSNAKRPGHLQDTAVVVIVWAPGRNDASGVCWKVTLA